MRALRWIIAGLVFAALTVVVAAVSSARHAYVAELATAFGWLTGWAR